MKETGVRFWSGVELTSKEETKVVNAVLQAINAALPPELHYRGVIKCILKDAISRLDYSTLDVVSSVEAEEEPKQ